ncbi:Pectate lyase/Amb allergen [Corchorus capsularis]|uniref:Pectate lyase n=1 Tax=Corchorus capsularis TaxID=210143 RepID=A0A1R3GKX9_COCAP|nr:Pectate lyase/Amb allergen [Corchorus capsularis]
MALINTTTSFSSFFFFLFFVVIIPTLNAQNIVEHDDYWSQLREQALNNTLSAYHPNPDEVTEHFNLHVASTRRSLRGRKRRGGPCVATNPIDACWRCNPNWEQNRFRLADCALGFARGTTGGKNGPFYLVTDSSDDDVVNPKPGTLRHAVIQTGPLWIIFARSMVIKLNQELIMTSDKTIDGRGANVHIAYGAGITIQFIRNVIIHNLHIHDIVKASGGMMRNSVDHFGFRTGSDGDGISLFGATNVWLDHLSIDASSIDEKMQITIAFTHFGKGLVQRMPRCRWGFIHVVNNDYTHWLMYAIGGSSHPTIISQGNRFIAPPNIAAKEVAHRNFAPPEVWMQWNWRSEGDLMVNGAFFTQSGDPGAIGKYASTMNMMGARPGEMAPYLTQYSGTLLCTPGQPC